MCSPLHLLHRPYCLTVYPRITLGIFRPQSTLSRFQHTSAKVSQQAKVSLLDKRVPGVNECPQNCLCSRNIEFSYKNPRFLSQFVAAQTGMIIPRTITKLCRRKQRRLARTIKRARHMGFMPYTHKQEEYLSDPRLF